VKLEPGARRYLIKPPSGDVAAAANEKLIPETARAVIQEVRCSLNQYRDERWDGVARARNIALDTMLIVGLFMNALLVIAILAGATQTQVQAAAVFYVAGVLAGLVSGWTIEIRLGLLGPCRDQRSHPVRRPARDHQL
jgi:hypothetical protein